MLNSYDNFFLDIFSLDKFYPHIQEFQIHLTKFQNCLCIQRKPWSSVFIHQCKQTLFNFPLFFFHFSFIITFRRLENTIHSGASNLFSHRKLHYIFNFNFSAIDVIRCLTVQWCLKCSYSYKCWVVFSTPKRDMLENNRQILLRNIFSLLHWASRQLC